MGVERAQLTRWRNGCDDGQLLRTGIALVVVSGTVLFFLTRSRSTKAYADLWREGTAPTDSPTAEPRSSQ
ncbi:hypothetical protein ADK43_16815 [Streptomyces rimosus subsp. rimosus]|nr:hypothetical protein ADK43_16815 [Streptomyces rimosus subsp. rimosus]